MSAIAEFVVNPSGRIEVMLGGVKGQIVGMIEPWDGPQIRNGLGKIRAYYWITLPVNGGGSQRRPTTSVAMARSLALKALADWFESARCNAVAEALALQSIDERDAAHSPALFRKPELSPR